MGTMTPVGTLFYATRGEHGLPQFHLTLDGAESHIRCVDERRRGQVELLTLEVKRVEVGDRNGRGELPTLRDLSIPEGK